MSGNARITNKLGKYLDADYFPAAIKGVYGLIGRVIFLERQVATLKQSLARTAGAPNMEGVIDAPRHDCPYMIDYEDQELPAGSIAVDVDGDCWWRTSDGRWECETLGNFKFSTLCEAHGPYCIIHVPEGGDE